MYFPCLVFPYQRSPSRWKTFVSVFTHTMPSAGGACADSALEAAGAEELAFFADEPEAAAGAAAGAEEAAEGVEVVDSFLDSLVSFVVDFFSDIAAGAAAFSASAFGALPTLTRDLISLIV